jgi:hypothetical protein
MRGFSLPSADVVELQSSTTQCILTNEQEGSRRRGKAAADDGATKADSGMTDLATASVCRSVASGRG